MADSQHHILKALLAEFVGTFAITFIGGSAYALTEAQGNSLVASALATGLALTFAIYIFNRWSGAHVNPSVSFGFALAGQMNWGLMLAYWVMQLVGAIAAGALVAALFGFNSGSGATIGSFTESEPWMAVLVEAVLTFFLVFGYLQLYRDSTTALVTGVVLGAVMSALVFAGKSLSGASTNPARTLGSAIFSNNMGSYWIYVLGPLIGSAVAVLVYKIMNLNFRAKLAKDCNGCQLYDKCGNRLVMVDFPMIDACGKPVKDCGAAVTERVLMVEPRLPHVQVTPMMEIKEMIRANGYSVDHIMTQGLEAFSDRNATKPAGQNDLVGLFDSSLKNNTIPVDAAAKVGAVSTASVLNNARNSALRATTSPY